jgi:hypothetical protein
MTNKEEDNNEEYENTNQNKNNSKKKDGKNFLENDKNIEALQLSIHRISKKIEEDKINLRILQERHTKKQSEYNQLAGKPIIKTREQKMEEMKEKMEKLKNHHQVFDPNYGKKEINLQPDEETKMIQKNTDKCKVELDNLIDNINKQVLNNAKLSREIEEIRKEKYRINEKLEKIEEQNKKIEEDLEIIKNRNNKIYNKIQFKELNKVKEKGKTIETQFLDQRDTLENKYHKVIEANIKREKEHKSDLRKIRLKNAIFADKARKKGLNHSMTTIGIKIEDQDEIHDRMPILDLLIDKWKFITKYKRNMLDKYIKYANEIRITFDKLLLYLGIEKLDKLPEIFTKNEQQMSGIESYLSSISTEVDNLNEQKSLLEKQIIILTQTKENEKEEKINVIEERKSKIQLLQKNNDELVENINRKKQIFKELEQPTFDFLRKMQKTYLTDFVVSKNNVEDNSKLNENNVINFLGTVYCYCQLIRDFDENVKYNNEINKLQENSDINKTIDILKKDMRIKLSKINYNNCVNDNIHTSINNVVKHGNDFDETIRRLANVIVDQVNNTGEYSLNNISSMNTNNLSS